MKHLIEEHLQYARLGKAIELALAITRKHQPKLYHDFTLISARYHSNEAGFNKGRIEPSSYKSEKVLITDAINYLLKDLDPNLTQGDLPAESKALAKSTITDFLSNEKDVFISYSRANKEVANKLYQKLIEKGFSVIIDEKALHAGYDFTQFIQTAVKESRYTITIISQKSLLSTWVTIETLKVLEEENADNRTKFLPCYVDKSFLETNFHIEAIDEIDKEIQKLDDAIIKLQQRRVDVTDLNAKRTRWYNLRNSLNKILKRLQSIRVVDLTENNFEKGVEELVAVIGKR